MLKKFFKKYKLVIVFLVITLVLMPFTIYKPAETEKVAVATSLGIDMDENKNIEVTLNILVPSGSSSNSEGGAGKVKTVTGKAKNISNAIDKISLELGRIVGLAHCDAVVIAENALNEDIIQKLDFFVRTNNLTSNAVIIITDKQAKKVIESSAQEKVDLALSLSNIINFNKEYLFTSNNNIEMFYEKYFSPSGIVILPVLTVTAQDQSISGSGGNEAGSSSTGTTQNSGNEVSSGESTSGQSSGSQQNTSENQQQSQSSGEGESSGNDSNTSGPEPAPKESGGESGGNEQGGQQQSGESGQGNSQASGQGKSVLKNEGQAVVIKKGKLVHKLTNNEVAALNLIDEGTTKGNITAKNVNNSTFNNATLNFEIYDKHVSKSGYFLEETPIFNIDIKVVLQLKEVQMENYSLRSLDSTVSHLDINVKHAIELSIHEILSETITQAKQNKTDVFGVYDYFHKFHNKKWKNFVAGLTDKEDYLNKVVFTISLIQQGKL